MLGQLQCSGVGTALPITSIEDEKILRQTCASSNAALLDKLREVGLHVSIKMRVACPDIVRTRTQSSFCNWPLRTEFPTSC